MLKMLLQFFKVNLKRKIVSDEITNVQKKKSLLQGSIDGRSNNLLKISRRKKAELNDFKKIKHEHLLRIEIFK